MRNAIVSTLLFLGVFVVVAFALVWGPLLMRTAERPARLCSGECEYDGARDLDGGPSWQRTSLWGPAGAPDLKTFDGLGTYEFVTNFNPDSRVGVAAKSVGRVQLLLESAGRLSKAACTGFLISADTVLTAAHCAKLQDKPATIRRVAIRFGFVNSGPNGQGTLVELDPATAAFAPAGKTADYLVLRFAAAGVAEVARLGLKPLVLSAALPRGGEDLVIIAHPLGVEQVAVRADCRVLRPMAPARQQ
jgi:hypothetical protein